MVGFTQLQTHYIRSWVTKRPVTVSLTVFIVVWYGFELLVMHTYGAAVAERWFYWLQPGNQQPTRVLFAPISHHLYNLTHIGANAAGLFFVGAFAEPKISSNTVFTLVFVFGYIGMVIANATAPLHQTWMIVGISGGLLSLVAYTGLHERHEFYTFVKTGATIRSILFTREKRNQFLATMLLLLTPSIFLYEIFFDSFNSGHTMGLVLGVAYYLIENRVSF